MELSGRDKAHANLLLELSRKRRLDRLIPFDAAAGKEPAGPIAVPHEEDAGRAVDDDALRAERQPAPHPPERTQHLGQSPHRERGRLSRRRQPCIPASMVSYCGGIAAAPFALGDAGAATGAGGSAFEGCTDRPNSRQRPPTD